MCVVSFLNELRARTVVDASLGMAIKQYILLCALQIAVFDVLSVVCVDVVDL